MITRILAVVVLWLFCYSFGLAEDVVEIPLSKIWALNMPGTKNVRELEPRQDQDLRKTVASKISRSLVYRNSEQANAGPCFLVIGEGKEALLNAAKVIVDGAPLPKTLPTDNKLSLVFYSYSAPGYVHLQSVKQSKSKLTVSYKVVIHRTLESTVHFALIPLGKRPAGQVSIETQEVPPNKPYTNHALTDRVVCDSCTFAIQNEGARQ
jgi:hypothetical protein